MKQHDLENLIRMAVEIDELERSALAGVDASAARMIKFSDVLRRPHWVRRLVVPFAAAALILLSFYPRSKEGPRDLTAAATGAFELAYCPAPSITGGRRIDHFYSKADEKCSVLALFHSWENDCQCLSWQVYEWEDGRSLTELTPNQIHEIALDVTDAPPVEQLLVVLIADKSEDLPFCMPDSCTLLECLNEVAAPVGTREGAASFASAVQSCVPSSVRVVPRSFYVE